MTRLHTAAGCCLLLGAALALGSAASGDDADYHLPRNYAPATPPAQPVSFSHARHVGALNLPCGTCHAGANTGGDTMMLPNSEVCMSCHRIVAIDNPAIRQLAALDQAGGSIAWVRVYTLLDGVNWSHRPHLGAGIDCSACHGDVAQLEVLSVATAITAMASCISCHRAGTANAQCETCHTWPSSTQLQQWNDE